MNESNNDPEEYSSENGYASVHELLAMNGINQRALIEKVNRDEHIEGRESYDMIKSDIKFNQTKTNMKKSTFIQEMKNGLGTEIKKNPKLIIKKKSWREKLGEFFKNIFIKF